MNKRTILGFAAFPLLAVLAPPGAAEIYSMVSTTNSMTPIYIAGHEGDPNQIEGFDYVFDLTLGGKPIGSETGTITVDSPPLDFSAAHTTGVSTSTYILTGLGSITAQCSGVIVATASTATTGAVAMASWCYLEDGAGALENVQGALSAYGTINLVTFQGSLTEIANIPEGVK